MQPGTVWAPLSGVPLLLLVVACASDARNRRIPNVLVLITAVTGILFAVIAKSWASGLWQAGAGLGTGLLIWLPLYALGMLGAGDVKLLAGVAKDEKIGGLEGWFRYMGFTGLSLQRPDLLSDVSALVPVKKAALKKRIDAALSKR